jgi:Rrf2 family iron-sulfur cluster assembly transcriptional regulator
MRLSTRARYAVRAMIDLAANAGNAPVTRDEIARRQAISPLYLSQILAHLSRADLVASSKGPGGGYHLTRPPAEISVAEIMDAVGETTEPAPCIVRPGSKCDVRSCKQVDTCAAHLLWQRLSDTISDTLASASLADLCASVQPCAESNRAPARRSTRSASG